MKKYFFYFFCCLFLACNTAENDAIKQQLAQTQQQIAEMQKQRVKDSLEKEVAIIALQDSMHAETNGNIKNLTELYQTLKSSIFFVYNYGNETASQGTAFVIGGGLALTNAHCIDEGEEIFLVNQTGQRFDVIEVVEQDAEVDYAVIRFKLNGKTFTPLTFATSLPAIGEPTFAIGNPRGLEQTLSTGIVSGYREDNKLIQTTTEIAGGSSGGPLFNKQGQVIGITTSGYTDANLNFAVNAQKINYLVATGKVKIGNQNTYIVNTQRAYFYETPNAAAPTTAYLIKNQKVIVIKQQNGFVYATYSNPQTATTTSGWLNLSNLSAAHKLF
jgi:serine protease Do